MEFLLGLSLPGLFLTFITFVVPKHYLGLYTSWLMLLFLWLWIELIKSESEGGFGYLIAWAFVNLNALILGIGIVIKIVLIYLKKNKNLEQLTPEQLYTVRTLSYSTFSLYGFVTAYLLNLFYGDIFAGYQPSWIAYVMAISAVLIVCLSPEILRIVPTRNLSNKRVIRKNIQCFSYSLCAVMTALLIFSLSITNTIIRETNQIIQQYANTNPAYCIQVMTGDNFPKKYRPLSALIDLSPLTMRSKARIGSWFGWGKPYFHAILVVDDVGATKLYNWSYQQRSWSYLENFDNLPSFYKPTIECVPQSNYLKQIPTFFPKK